MWLIWGFIGFFGFVSQAQQPATLNGVWLRPCEAGNIQVQTFQGPINSTQDIFFTDRNCQSPMMAFLNGGDVKIRSGEIDYYFKQVSVVLYSQTMVSDYNQRAVCGITYWRLNSPRDVTGLQCAFFQPHKKVQVPRAGDARFGIWKIENGQLNFGLLDRESPGTSPDKRPVLWDLRTYFKQR